MQIEQVSTHATLTHPSPVIISNNITCWGLCLRNELGEFIAAKTAWSTPCMHVAEGEAQSILFALEWISSLGLSMVVIDSYCKKAVDSINGSRVDDSEFGSIIKDCSMILLSSPNFIVRFIRRQTNGVVYSLAKMAPTIPSPQDFQHVPHYISLFITSEIN